jgi:hypothetical protein
VLVIAKNNETLWWFKTDYLFPDIDHILDKDVLRNSDCKKMYRSDMNYNFYWPSFINLLITLKWFKFNLFCFIIFLPVDGDQDRSVEFVKQTAAPLETEKKKININNSILTKIKLSIVKYSPLIYLGRYYKRNKIQV